MREASGGDERTLGFASLLALGINGVVGVGIFFAPSKVAALVPGRLGVAVYGLTALLLLPVALTYARLGGRFAEDGGPYVWARAAFGSAVGFAVGWIAWVSAVFSSSAVVLGLAEHAGPELGFAGPAGERWCAVLAVVLLTAAVASGLKPSAFAWNVITILKLVPLLALVAFAVTAAGSVQQPTGGQAAPSGGDLGRAVLVVVFATQGFEIVPVPAGNARRSARAIPLATVGALVLATALYVALHWACVVALPNLAAEHAPLVAAAGVHGGDSLAWLVRVGTNVSALGIALGMFAMTPRYLAALGRYDAVGGNLGREGRAHVPYRALLATAACVLVMTQLGGLAQLFVLSSVAVLTQYAVSAAALVVLAWLGRHSLSRADLWPAPLALAAILLMGQAARWQELAVAGVALGVGGLLVALRHAMRRWSRR